MFSEFKLEDVQDVWYRDGLVEGRAEGLAEGEAKTALNNAINAIRAGFDTASISVITGL